VENSFVPDTGLARPIPLHLDRFQQEGMIMTEKVLLAWSGGKDSAMALYEIRKNQRYEILALITTVTEEYDRISMHGVRRILLERQAESLGLPLQEIFISKNESSEEYGSKMREVLAKFYQAGVSSVVFGDTLLEDVREYREDNLSKIGMKGLFPLWKRDTSNLVKTSINLGFKAVVTCVDSKVLDKRFVGRLIDKRFLAELPPTVDPCGENGEYHSFVFDGPIFNERILYILGEVVLRDSFYFCDLIPVDRSVS